MTSSPKNLDLLPGLPLHFAPAAVFLDIPTVVPSLLDLYPQWTLGDLEEFIETRTRKAIHPEDQNTLAAVYHRCVRLRREFEGWEPMGE